MKAVILARVSTLKQEKEGLSLKEIQLPILQEYAKNKGFEIEKEFVFNESADQKIRKKFKDMVSYIKKRSDIKVVIAYRVDRITRNFRDAVLVDELIKDYDKEVHFVDDKLVINNDSMSRDIQTWDLKVFLAKQYLNRLKEDAKSSAMFKLKRGEWPGQAPFGYDNVTRKDKRKWIVPSPFEAEIVNQIYELYSQGAISMLGLKHKLKDKLGMDLAKSQIERILKNKFYAGIMQYDGEEYPHEYEQLITMELYEKVQAMKDKNGQKNKGIKHGLQEFAYRGLIKCDVCGSSMTAVRKKGKYVYYKCTEHYQKHQAQYVKEEEITRQIQEAYNLIHIEKNDLIEILQTLKESHKDKEHFNKSQIEAYQSEYKKYATRIERMYEDKLDGLITAEEYKTRLQEYRDHQVKLEIKLKQLRDADESYYLSAEYLLSLALRAGELFESSKIDQKRQLLTLTFRNLTLNDKKLVYDWAEPFDKLVNCASRHKWQPLVDYFCNFEGEFEVDIAKVDLKQVKKLLEYYCN